MAEIAELIGIDEPTLCRFRKDHFDTHYILKEEALEALETFASVREASRQELRAGYARILTLSQAQTRLRLHDGSGAPNMDR
jgi:hypothetical protein